MANSIDNKWGKGVIYASGIDLASKKPLDSRISVNTIAERDEHITGNRAYEGMQVYVTATEKTYILINGEWKTLVNSTDIVNDITTGGADKVLSAEQGKTLKAAIDAVSGGELSVPVAAADKIGGIKSGSGDGIVSVSAEGVASVASAPKLGTARTISLTGDATGSVEFDGSADASIEVTVADNSHAHTIENVTGLETRLTTIETEKAPIASPEFTGVPKAPTAAVGTDTTQVATTAYVKAEINEILKASGALKYSGPVAAASDLPAKPSRIGDTYVATASFELEGEKIEPGDMIICKALTGADKWSVVQANIDGAVVGPATAVNEHIALFDGATGKLIKDSGFTIGQSVPAESVWKIGDDVTDAVHGLMTSAQKARLEAITDADYKNVAGFAKVNVNGADYEATAIQDTLTLKAGNGVSLSATGKEVTITGTTYDKATAESDGLMSKEDFSKLAGIEAGAQKNVQSDWSATEGDAAILNKPTSMKNPAALTITAGSASVEYIGDSAKSINITSESISAMPLISGTAGHMAVVDADGNKVADGGFSIPAPTAENIGSAVFAKAEGEYEVRKAAVADVEGLQIALDAKASKVASATADNLASLNADGSIADSGLAKSKVVLSDDFLLLQCALE